MILYEVINERPDALAERTYAVWPDLEALMREHGVPQLTVDGHRAVRDFDLLGVSFSTELGYTNLLTALDLAGIPLHAADRTDADPVVIAGGHAAFNPEPIADFVDAAVVGDGEEAVLAITDLVGAVEARGAARGARTSCCSGWPAPAGSTSRPSTTSTYLPDGRIQRVAPNTPGVPWRVCEAHRHGPRLVALPQAAPRPARRDRPRADVGRDLPRVHPRLPVLPGRDDHPTGPGALDHRRSARWSSGGSPRPGSRRSGCSRSPRPTTPRSRPITKGLADRYEGTQTGLSLPSTRVDAFNIDLANELTRNGRRSGLTFAPEGGSERIRRVINKMVTEEDLIATVSAAYGAGWRQVKLYFMCGLPTETDEDVLQIAEVAKRVIETGRQVSGRRDIRCTVSIGGFVPKPHTPFQWAAQLGAEETDARLEKLRAAIRSDRRYGSSIGFRYHDGRPGIVEGLLSRGDRRVGRVIEAVWRDGGRFDGWSEHFSYERWMAAAER